MDETTIIGQVVHYRLSQQDVQEIEKWRQSTSKALGSESLPQEDVRTGQVYPAIITRMYGGSMTSPEVSLKVFLEGPHDFWTTARSMGQGEGKFEFAPIVEASIQQRQGSRA
jgi:hypothetical protein